MKHIIREIHRRSLWQVLGIYLAGSWIALQVVDVLANNFGLPPWFPPLALALLILGLPVVLATAFVQEGVGGREKPAGGEGAAAGGEGAAAVGGESASDATRTVTGPSVGHRKLLTWRNAILGGVGAFALWGLVAAGWLLLGQPAGAGTVDAAAREGAPPLRSIAVLPFVTRSEDRQDEFFAEGMHDDLLTQLAKIDSLDVISRTSVMQYAGTTKTIRTIAGELGVSTVLEGGIQRAGDRVRVNVQLIEASSDRHLWAETYDEELTAANVFAIQSDLAQKIARALQATLTPAVARRIEARPTESLEAYDAYVSGRYLLQHRGLFGEQLDEVRAFFEEAIAADSSFAGAWLGLAEAHLSAGNWRREPFDEALPKARTAVERALALDPDLAEAHLSLARLLQFESRFQQAERAVLRARELSPGSAEVYARYGAVLQDLGRFDESVAAARRAVELDPLAVNHRHALSDRLFFAGRFEESATEARHALAMAPDDWYAWYSLGWARAAGGHPEEATASFHRALQHTSDNRPTIQAGLAYAFATAGSRDSALFYLDATSASAVGYDYGLVLYVLGDAERAFASLEAVLREEPDQLHRLRRDPSAEILVADGRFQSLIRRLGLE